MSKWTKYLWKSLMESQLVLNLIAQAAEEQWEELDLSGMALSELPPEIGNLVSLKRLVLAKWDKKKARVSGNNLTVLPEELRQLRVCKVVCVKNFFTSETSLQIR
jgi:Leucine-rich repeat (LRR) protein